LCAHHYQQHERELVHAGVRVLIDQRRQLQPVGTHA
jgi:hypothetical protein